MAEIEAGSGATHHSPTANSLLWRCAERDAEDRRQGRVVLSGPSVMRHYRDGGVCWSRSQFQIWNPAVSKRARGGHQKVRALKANWGPGRRRAMRREHGMMAGGVLCCRWRTRPPHSRARPSCSRTAQPGKAASTSMRLGRDYTRAISPRPIAT
jgi:hypothetical protein